MKKYVVGFAFLKDYVVLIRKNKPEWQKDKLNGLGGSMEEGESPEQSMAREFWEEAGVFTEPGQWKKELLLVCSDCYLEVLSTQLAPDKQPYSASDEGEVGFYDPCDLPSVTLPNVRWIIPLILNRRANNHPKHMVLYHT